MRLDRCPLLSARRLVKAWELACLAACLAQCIAGAAIADEPSFQQSVQPFLNHYCVSCHGEDERKGDRRFDTIGSEIANDDTLVDYQDILDQLNLAEMPPQDADQPTDQQRRVVIEWLTTKIHAYHRANQNAGGRSTIRRLNAREYRNTIRDLFALNMAMFDPTRKFPRDQTSENLDNVGDALVISGHLLGRYLDSADAIVAKALGPADQPVVQHWRFDQDLRQQPEIDQVHTKTNGFDRITLYDVIGADKHEGAYGPILAFADGVPVDGVYEIRLRAEALNREHPYDPEFLGTDPSEPLRLGIVAGNRRVGNLHVPQPVEPLLAEQELADHPQWYTFRVWLDAGFTPRFTFRNGLMDVRNLYARLIKKYRDQFPPDIKRGIVAARFNAIKHGKLPQIQIHEIEISGPHYESWPTPSQRAMLVEDWVAKAGSERLTSEPLLSSMRQRIHRFATRAYRRPVTDSEVDRVMAVIQSQLSAGKQPLQAYADGLKVVLCSPAFLYLDQSTDRGRLVDTALASRLSYFLWSSMPDEELFQLALGERLKQREVLRQQVLRMLADPKSDAFIQGFLDAWLGLRDLGATPPDRNDFRAFYHYDLDSAMRRETFLFTRSIVDENLPVSNFVDSDFTFVNRPLARLYGIEPPDGFEFAKVSLRDRRRGGLLGQASILTLTANGIDTSPVVRGVWLLNNLLGTPPSPPPPDVEPLDPDVRGAKTIRQQLQKHRSVASCYDCHRKIDPLGFALENFDPIGRWREHYNTQAMIDASGELPGGRSFDDVQGLKAILVQRQESFARSIIEKLLSYSIGRHVTAADRPHVDAILDATRSDGFRLRDIIVAVVLSDPFGT